MSHNLRYMSSGPFSLGFILWDEGGRDLGFADLGFAVSVSTKLSGAMWVSCFVFYFVLFFLPAESLQPA